MAIRSVWVSWRKGRKRWEVGYRWNGKTYQYYAWTFQGRKFVFTDENKHIADEFAAHIRAKMRPNVHGVYTFDPSEISHGKTTSLYRFENYMELWLKEKKMMVKAGDRKEEYYGHLKRYNRLYLSKKLTGLSILEINTPTLKDLYFWLAEKGLSKKYRQNIMDALHQIMKQAFEETRLPLPKFPDYKEKKHERSIPDFISEEDQDLVIENTPSIHRPIVRMIAYHGLRQYEARNLKIADFKDDRTVNVETAKCGPPRRILLDPLVIKDIKSVPRCLFHQFLFHYNGKPYAKTTLWKIIRKALNETGLNHITPSEFGRHSHATHILQRGGSTRMAQEILGHADIRTTERYTHVLVDDQATVSRIASSSQAVEKPLSD